MIYLGKLAGTYGVYLQRRVMWEGINSIYIHLILSKLDKAILLNY